MDPSICLDASQAFLGVTRLQAKKSLRIEAKKINQDDSDYVLFTDRDTYISNGVSGKSQRIMIVSSGYYHSLQWSLPLVSPWEHNTSADRGNSAGGNLLDQIPTDDGGN